MKETMTRLVVGGQQLANGSSPLGLSSLTVETTKSNNMKEKGIRVEK